MAGYFGTETQQRLQAHAETSVEFFSATAGACQAGRFMGCDDPDQLGWERIEAFIDRDDVFGFRLIPVAKADEIRSQLMKRNCRLDTWDVFLADRAKRACRFGGHPVPRLAPRPDRTGSSDRGRK